MWTRRLREVKSKSIVHGPKANRRNNWDVNPGGMDKWMTRGTETPPSPPTPSTVKARKSLLTALTRWLTPWLRLPVGFYLLSWQRQLQPGWFCQVKCPGYSEVTLESWASSFFLPGLPGAPSHQLYLLTIVWPLESGWVWGPQYPENQSL